ncbi:MAG: ABC transporter ATP-binding protein [Clostridia bacterium]|nr:ABC transporter ATP-binding protein [Clostridia bacterium]
MNNKSVFNTDTEENLIKSFENNKRNSFKTLLSLYKGSYHKLFFALIFFIIKRSPEWVLPIVTANIINIATSPTEHSLKELILNCVVMVVFILQNVPTNYIYFKVYRQTIRNIEARLRCALVRKMQQLSITFHKEMRSGKLQSKIMRDVEAIETLSTQFFINVLQIAMDLAVAIFITASMNFTVLLFFALTVPFAVILVTLFRKKIRQRNNEYRKEVEETSAMVMEMVELIPVTRAHGLQSYEIDRMGNQMEKVSRRGLKLDVIQELFGSMTWVTFQVFQLGCLVFTGYLAYKGEITVGEVVLYQNYYSKIVHQVSNLVGLLPSMSKGLESVRSVGDVLSAMDVEDNTSKKSVKNVSGNIEFSSVTFKYHDADSPVLSDFSLSVKKGETIALVGESGAGKTTILNLIMGFNQPTEGKITVDGNDITKINLNSLRNHLAVVPQNTILFTGTLRDNITYGLNNVDEKRLNEVIEAANLKELVQSLPDGLETHINEHGSNLSGGQRQRISIARALIRDPEIIILDEATSALDTISEKKIQSAIDNLSKDRTTFIVAHRLSTIRNADRIAVIDSGKCVECGSFDELIEKKGKFYELNKMQVM